MKTMTTILASLLFTATAQAEITLNIPDNVDLLVVNQSKPDIDGGLFSTTKSVTLPDGENQIVVRYKPYFSKGNDRIIVEGEAIIANFSAQDQTLNFQLPEYRNERDAEKNIKQLQLALTNQEGQSIPLVQDTLKKDGLQIGRDYVIESELYNQNAGVAALSSSVAAVAISSSKNQSSPLKANGNTAEEMLHFWYQKADDKTKAKFKQFVNQQ
ncbi:hypothetical protein VII00023_06912 [Vibrio ichthyoenteri ATCC 700023]|uniref:UPF0319 protein VII00023_06912 n=1 Tax=Vibrio ichthyoenteri ATCC 700023 TaxID=870968 RepID=F9RYY6_9VIBR|nr:DUF2057 family protein [Vibrio ichthyoenteri]EGU46248.1 hypothetical protein VII00023_06912 [Vibrio ichthyoenteri ATCC 700023]